MAKVGPKTDANVDDEVATRVDPGLDKLYEAYQKRETVANQSFVTIIEYVRDNKLSRATVKATLEGRGLTDSSVSTEVSRIMGLAKEENREIVEKLADKEITVAAARKAIAKPQEHPAQSAADRLWAALYRAAKSAYKESMTNEEFSLKYFTTEAANAWNQVKDEYEAKERAAQEAAAAAAEQELEGAAA